MQVKEEMFLQIRRASEVSFRYLGWNWDSGDFNSGTAWMSVMRYQRQKQDVQDRTLANVPNMYSQVRMVQNCSKRRYDLF
jgi:hypothetical protein